MSHQQFCGVLCVLQITPWNFPLMGRCHVMTIRCVHVVGDPQHNLQLLHLTLCETAGEPALLACCWQHACLACYSAGHLRMPLLKPELRPRGMLHYITY